MLQRRLSYPGQDTPSPPALGPPPQRRPSFAFAPQRRRPKGAHSRRVKRRRRAYATPPRHRRFAALQPRPVDVRPSEPSAQGTLYVNATPSARVELGNQLLGYTPINGKQVAIGNYRLLVRCAGYHPIERFITIRPDRTTDLDLRLVPLEAPTPRKINGQTGSSPPPSDRRHPSDHRSFPAQPSPQRPFRDVMLPLQRRLRVYISDQRGIVGRIYTEEHQRLCQQIEKEVTRLLGSSFVVRGVTRPWQRHIRQEASRQNQTFWTFYPRAAALVIYRELARGRSIERVGQLLVLYQRRNRFRLLLNP